MNNDVVKDFLNALGHYAIPDGELQCRKFVSTGDWSLHDAAKEIETNPRESAVFLVDSGDQAVVLKDGVNEDFRLTGNYETLSLHDQALTEYARFNLDGHTFEVLRVRSIRKLEAPADIRLARVRISPNLAIFTTRAYIDLEHANTKIVLVNDVHPAVDGCRLIAQKLDAKSFIVGLQSAKREHEPIMTGHAVLYAEAIGGLFMYYIRKATNSFLIHRNTMNDGKRDSVLPVLRPKPTQVQPANPSRGAMMGPTTPPMSPSSLSHSKTAKISTTLKSTSQESYADDLSHYSTPMKDIMPDDLEKRDKDDIQNLSQSSTEGTSVSQKITIKVDSDVTLRSIVRGLVITGRQDELLGVFPAKFEESDIKQYFSAKIEDMISKRVPSVVRTTTTIQSLHVSSGHSAKRTIRGVLPVKSSGKQASSTASAQSTNGTETAATTRSPQSRQPTVQPNTYSIEEVSQIIAQDLKLTENVIVLAHERQQGQQLHQRFCDTGLHSVRYFNKGKFRSDNAIASLEEYRVVILNPQVAVNCNLWSMHCIKYIIQPKEMTASTALQTLTSKMQKRTDIKWHWVELSHAP